MVDKIKEGWFRAIVEQAPDAVIFADRDGITRIWNLGAEAVFGYSEAEVLGKSLDLIIPEQLRRAHWEGFHRAVEAGNTRLGRQALATRSIHKNGNKLYLDLTFGIVKNESGQVVGAMAVAREITSRYLAEVDMRKHVLELEEKLKALSKHDSSGPLLSSENRG
ncbi:MAG: PAS domain-containing protein [Pyrinomonadaceae bacterium]